MIRIPGVNFTNILCAAFTLVGPKSAKRHCQLGCLFAHTGSARVKAARRTLMKLSPGGGSDVASLKTTAVRKGDDLIINGQKVKILKYLNYLSLFH